MADYALQAAKSNRYVSPQALLASSSFPKTTAPHRCAAEIKYIALINRVRGAGMDVTRKPLSILSMYVCMYVRMIIISAYLLRH